MLINNSSASFFFQENESQLSDDQRPVATVAPHAAPSTPPPADVSTIILSL